MLRQEDGATVLSQTAHFWKALCLISVRHTTCRRNDPSVTHSQFRSERQSYAYNTNTSVVYEPLIKNDLIRTSETI